MTLQLDLQDHFKLLHMEEVEVVVLIHHLHILLCPVLQVHRVAADQNH